MGGAIQIGAIISGIIDPNTGLPASGGSVEFYAPGGVTAKEVWTEAEKSNSYTSYTLDSAGSAHLYGDGIYDVVVRNSLGAEIYSWDGLLFRSPDYTTTEISTSYNQVASDDAIVVTSSATGDVTINLLAPASWEEKPLTITNASSYTVYIESSDTTINGEAAVTIASGAAPISIARAGDVFYMSGASSDRITALTTGRHALAEDDGLSDNDSAFAKAFYLTGDGEYSCRIISAAIDVKYASGSNIDVEISDTPLLGFAAPTNSSSGALSAGGSINGVSLSADGSTIMMTPSLMFPTADDAKFVGVLAASVAGYVTTTSGVPSVFSFVLTEDELRILYYEDGAAGNLINATATAGDTIRFLVCYAMRPVND